MDSDNDGTINLRHENTYDASGNLIQFDYEDARPRAVTRHPDYRDTRTYNGEGSMLRSEYDVDVDGSVDTWCAYTYDYDNYLIRMERGGEAPEAQVYTYTLANGANGYIDRVPVCGCRQRRLLGYLCVHGVPVAGRPRSIGRMNGMAGGTPRERTPRRPGKRAARLKCDDRSEKARLARSSARGPVHSPA